MIGMRSQELKAALCAQIEATKQAPENPDAYDRIYESLEAYRDSVAKSGSGPEVSSLVEEAHALACQAHEKGIIDEGMAQAIGLIGNSLLFVSDQSAVVL